MRFVRIFTVIIAVLTAGPAAAEPPTLRLGLLSFGTVQWEIETMLAERLDAANGIKVEVVTLANKNAAAVALHGGTVDAIVSDWFWVSRQRAMGDDLTFAPWSSMSGMVLVPAASDITGLDGLKGKRLGISGGPIDKGWLLLRALAAKDHGLDLDRQVEKSFGAPPLLVQQFEAGRLDALLTFWQHGVPLELKGMRKLIDVAAIPERLGVGAGPPLLGWVFHRSWAEANPAAVQGLLAAGGQTKRLLCDSEQPWLRIAHLTQAKDGATREALRNGYCRGVPGPWGEAELRDAQTIFRIVGDLGGADLVGPSRALQDGTFFHPAGR